jgi:hypothetical protein
MPTRTWLRLGVLAAALSICATGTGVARGEGSCTGIAPPNRLGSTIAKVVVAANVRQRPGGGQVLWRAPTRTRWGGNPSWLLTLGCAFDGDGTRWLRVALPIRPNEAAGWIRADFVLVARTTYAIAISTGRARVDVVREGQLVRRASAVVGAASTPTPHGLFAVYDAVPQPSRDGFVGPWVIHLTAHSDVLDNYGGGPGRVAIHGRGGASLRVPLGSAASHGCIRVDNDVVSWIARHVPAGAPVFITP